MRAAEPLEQRSRLRAGVTRLLAVLGVAMLVHPARAAGLGAPIADLYSSVSIFPPTAKSMTVCYGFVCRRREISISPRATATR